MIRREYSSEDIANFPIRQGRGYDRQDVDVFRQTALAAVRTLEERVERANAEAQQPSQQVAMAPDLKAIAASLSPEELERVGLMAIGLELTNARNNAARRLTETQRKAYSILATARTRLIEALAELDNEAAPALTAHELRVKIAHAISALGLPESEQGATESTIQENGSRIQLYR